MKDDRQARRGVKSVVVVQPTERKLTDSDITFLRVQGIKPE
jgi:hypothetical protein